MGCDVHFFLERKVNRGPWCLDPGHGDSQIDLSELVSSEDKANIDWPKEIPTLSARNYIFFSLIAGVRGVQKKFIKPRGMPRDVCPTLRAIYSSNLYHTPSWISIKELRWALSKLEGADYEEFGNYMFGSPNKQEDYKRAGDADSTFKDSAWTLDDSVIRYVERYLEWENIENELLGTKNKTRFRLVFWFDS